MNLVILIGLVVIGMAHGLRGILALRGGTRPPSVVAARRRMVLPLTGALLSLAGSLVGWSAELPVPIGYAGGAGGLALDPLACIFSLILFAASAWCDTEDPTARCSAGLRDLRVAAILLVFLSGDAFLLACGACLALLLPQNLLGRRALHRAMLGAFAIAGACSVLSGPVAPVGGLLADPGFVLLRAGGGTASLLLPVLVLLAAMPLLGLWPMFGGFRHRCAFAPVWVPATGALLGQFLLIRLLLDLAGPVVSPVWGAVLVLLGAASSVLAGWSGVSERRASGVVGCVLANWNGLGVVAIGLCLLARCNDLPVLAGSALDAALLLAPTSVLGGLSCLALVRAMEAEAGSGLLSRLGGLVRSMPYASLALLLPLCLLGAVPPLSGFVVLWLLEQIVLATPLPMLAGVAVPSLLLMLSVALAAGLGAAGLLRLGTVALLGRPRTPRGAAATDLDRGLLLRHLWLLALPVLAGLAPGGWLRLAAGQGGGEAVDQARHALFWLVAPAGNAVFSPLPVVLLLGCCFVATLVFARVIGVQPERRQRGWEGGAAPPPPWLPFGDPATQIAPATLPLSLHQALALPASRSRPGRWRSGSGRATWLLRRGRGTSTLLHDALSRHGSVLGAVALVVLFGVVLLSRPAP